MQRERAWGGRGNKKTLTEINNHLWWLFRKSSCLYLLLHLLYEWNLSENQYMVTTRGNYENVKKAKNEISELNNYFQGVLSWFSSDKIWVLAPTVGSKKCSKKQQVSFSKFPFFIKQACFVRHNNSVKSSNRYTYICVGT